MCGVVGALSFKGAPFTFTQDYIAAMRDVMIHRGPDGAGVWIEPGGRVALGHRRLSIIDLSPSAAQPMSNEAGTLWLSFNGEIYNHADIRRELVACGRTRWKTDHSDTEVILQAFEQWGIDCLDRFRGMFAFALWDSRSREMWLVRDRIGIKPLYYSMHHGRITFASELKALLQDPEQERRVDEESFYHYMTFLTAPAPNTFFEGIKKLPPGTWLRIQEDGSTLEKTYWDVWDHTVPMTGRSDEAIAEQLLAELRTSVRLRKESDVPVGVFLSGGVDSSTNAVLFSEGESSPVKTFTISYDGEYKSYPNELRYARLMAELIKAEHHELVLSLDDLVAFLPQMIKLQDEPLGDPVSVPLYYVSKLARSNGVIVCQVGEGADELFWGYPGWRRPIRLEQARALPVPRFLKSLALLGLRQAGKGAKLYSEWLRRDLAGLPIFWGGTDAITEERKRQLLSPRLRRRFKDLSSWEPLAPIHRRFREAAWEQTTLNWMSYADLRIRLPELMLMRVDKMSMGVSLEGRVPFLDHKFVELAMSIPTAVKTRHGELKHILKRAVRGVIPDEIIDRQKQGFNVPVHEWFFERLGGLALKEMEDFCAQTDFLDKEEACALMTRGPGHQAWYLLNFALWWKEYIGGSRP
mgnify:FL=1